MFKTYPQKLAYNPSDKELESWYEAFLLPLFAVEGTVTWLSHTQTDLDNYVHAFNVGDRAYALAFDDYPSGFSDLQKSTSFTKVMRTIENTTMLQLESPYDRYTVNASGYFMLFEITDQHEFDTRMNYLHRMYIEWQNQHEEVSRTVYVARDILRLAENASFNNDSLALYGIASILDAFIDNGVEDGVVEMKLLKEYIQILMDAEDGYEVTDPEQQKTVRDTLYKALSKDTQFAVTKVKYIAEDPGSMVTLVTAAYARKEKNVTSGVTAAFVMQDTTVTFPLPDGILVPLLKEYLAENDYIQESNIKYHLPDMLGEYTLVEGTPEIRRIFSRELPYINF